MMEKFLFRQVDSSPLIVFRIIFGLLLFLESVGAIFTGWVKRIFIEPAFTFNFIGFEFLQPLDGWGMYYYYALMGFFGLCVMLGFKYRLAMFSFFLMWTASYLMQKSAYNNHYYLTGLLSFLMIFLPANKSYSIDTWLKPKIRSHAIPYWCIFILIVQIGLVYFYGGLAKIYPDWLNAVPLNIMLDSKVDMPVIGSFLSQDWLPYLLSYGGLIFDLLIIPLLVFKRTRLMAFSISVFFHLFNAVVFQIGIFPFLALAFTVFFFEPLTIKNLFLKGKPFYHDNKLVKPNNAFLIMAFLGVYLLVQLALPLRHWFIKGNVLFTEEGHRLSWRMMLRSKIGYQNFTLVDKETGRRKKIDLKEHLSIKQIKAMSTKPDMIWQFAQHLKKEQKGKEVKIYVKGKVSVNGRPYQTLVNENIDLASVEWDHFKHSNWLVPFKD